MKTKTKQVVGMVLVAISLLGIFAACAKSPAPQEGTMQSKSVGAGKTATELRDTLVIGTESEPPTLHPFDHKAVTAGYMNSLTFNAMMKTNPQTLEPELDLAAAYENSSDTEWLFTVQDGVLFQDGSALDAQDVKASMEYARTYPTTKDYASFWTDVEVVDEKTVKITTDGPYAMVLNDMASIYILPSELIAAGNDFNENPIGTGPYRFVRWERGDCVQFESYDQYFDAAHKPQIKNLIWRIIPEGASRTIALQAGEVDFVMEVEATDIHRLQEDEAITLQKTDGTRLNFMSMNNQQKPFDNKWFRKAINAAVDKEAVVTVACDGEGVATRAQTSPAFAGSSENKGQGYDPEQAAQYLKQSGVDPADVKFSCLVSNDVARRTAEVIQANLAEIGIQMDIESMDYATYLSAIMSGDYAAAIAGYTSRTMYSFVSGLYHSSSINAANLARVDDPTVDRLIEAAKIQLDGEAQAQTYQQLSEYLNDWAPFVPLYQSVVVKAYNKDLNGVVVSKTGAVRFEDVSWAQ